MTNVAFPRTNNLEWLRLAFALQVVAVHVAHHLNGQLPTIISYFPGVPAFFFVSGFLIYASYQKAQGRQFFENRIIRLYPALVFVTIGGIAVVLVNYGARDLAENFPIYALWFLSQTTIAQAYNPAHFRDVGVGVVNGSLWTITTEILFYISAPLIVRMERIFRYAVIFLLLASFTFYAIGPSLLSVKIYREKTLYDLLAITPIAWGWMFAFGILAYKHYSSLSRYIKYFPLAIVPPMLMVAYGKGVFFNPSGNRLGLIYFICYFMIIMWAAFKIKYIPLRHDLSYGIYVWHMPVINLLLTLGLPSPTLAVGSSILLGALSWILVERPALRLKRTSLRD